MIKNRKETPDISKLVILNFKHKSKAMRLRIKIEMRNTQRSQDPLRDQADFYPLQDRCVIHVVEPFSEHDQRMSLRLRHKERRSSKITDHKFRDLLGI